MKLSKTGLQVLTLRVPYISFSILESALIVEYDGSVAFQDDKSLSAESQCPLCTSQTQGGVEGISTLNGNYSQLERDLETPVAGGSLSFERNYASGGVGRYDNVTTLQTESIVQSAIGGGWVHNYEMRLVEGEIDGYETLELQTHGGSFIPFFVETDGTYTPAPGVTASLTYDPASAEYTITAYEQSVYVFDDEGRLIEKTSPMGHSITFSYSSGKLSTAQQGGRSLTYGYNTDGRLETVTDQANRVVTLGYDPVTGDLTSVTNPLNEMTTYTYDVGDGLLTKKINPLGVIVREISYDSEGRAYEVKDSVGTALTTITFPTAPTGGLIESYVVHNGVPMIHQYDARRTLVSIVNNCGTVAGCQESIDFTYDENFKTTHVTDMNGHTTELGWDLVGNNVESVTDELGNTTSFAYNIENSVTSMTDTLGSLTEFRYEDSSYPTFRTKVIDALNNETNYEANSNGYLDTQTDPNGVETTYQYNAYGQVTQMVVGAQSSNPLTTVYTYDEQGNLETTTQVSSGDSQTSLNVYDANNQLIGTITDWQGSDPDNWQDNCPRDMAVRSQDICMTYAYDVAGRVISTINPIGQVDLYDYHPSGWLTLVVENVEPSLANDPPGTQCALSGPEYNHCTYTFYDNYGRVIYGQDPLYRVNRTFYDDLGRVSQTVTNYDDGIYDPLEPDTDIITQYEYDAAGNTIKVTDVLGRTNRSFYNELNRLRVSINNWSGAINSVVDAQTTCYTLPAQRDTDICTFYSYDRTGNLIYTQDALGRYTRTFYDELNRVAASVQNWDEVFLATHEDCEIPNSSPWFKNLCTLNEYDDSGNLVTTTNALGQISLTVYDELNRPYLRIANWDGITPINSEADCQFPPVSPDENLCTVTYYDDLGRSISTKDPLGRIVDQTYDDANGQIITTRYLDGQSIETLTGSNALGSTVYRIDANGNQADTVYDSLNRVIQVTSPEGVSNFTTYDEVGRVIARTDGLGHITTNQYDGLNRLISSTDPLNNTTTYEYDGLGNRIAMIDAEGVRTGYVYDGLNLLVAVVENEKLSLPVYANDTNVTTQYEYDVLGNQLGIISPNSLVIGQTIYLEQTTYDVLNRPETVLDGLGNTTSYTYDAIGNRLTMVDGNGETTSYQYDGLNRLFGTSFSSESDETVLHVYDALGNLLTMRDGQGVTQYAYDELNRLISVENPSGDTLTYVYDDVGNRTRLSYPDTRDVDYLYDGDNRLVTVTDWDGGVATYTYDDAGRLTTTTLPNGVITTQEYDGANRLSALRHHAADSSPLAQYLYELDNVGNRINASETYYVPSTDLALTLSNPLTVTTLIDEQRIATSAYNTTADEYLVAWQDESGGDTNLAVRILDETGNAVEPEFSLPTIPDIQDQLNVAYSAVGDVYLLVWSDQRNGNRDIYGQLLAPNGQPIGNEVVIDNDLSTTGRDPRVTYDPDSGGFVVVWANGNGSNLDIQVQFIDETGVLGANFAVTSGLIKDDTPSISTDGSGTFLVVWQQDEDVLADIMGQLFTSAGLKQSVFAISDAIDLQDKPAVSFHADSEQYLVVWEHKDVSASPRRIHARFVTIEGETPNPAFVFDDFGTNPTLYPDVLGLDDGFLVTAHRNGNVFAGTVSVTGEPDNLTVLSQSTNSQYRVDLAGGNDTALAVWESDELGTDYDLFGKLATLSVAPGEDQTTFISYTYDPLYRPTDIVYTSGFEATYLYSYDAVGNRLSQVIVTDETETVTYEYDLANRLIESADIDGIITTYTWDDASRLTTVTVDGVVTRNYQYSQDGDMASAIVDGVTTSYTYDGLGNRLMMSVAGEDTTYTVDYANGFRLLYEQGGAFSETKHYLYGYACLGEVADVGTPDEESRYYLRDGNRMVRQVTDESAIITLAWTYSPEGMVLLGEQGLVTNLDCSGNAIYDFSTGLIFKNRRYFDPSTGIYTTMGGIVIYRAHFTPNRRLRRRKERHFSRKYHILLLLLLVLLLASCGSSDNSTPIPNLDPTEVPTTIPCTPTSIPTVISTATPTIGPIGFATAIPTRTPSPVPTADSRIPLLIAVAKEDKEINQSLPDDSVMRMTIQLLLEQSAIFNLSSDETAYLLASVAHESHMGNPTFMEEFADGWDYDPSVNPVKASQLGNTEVGDGPKFKGRGLIQLTGRKNYQFYKELTGRDLINEPNILLTDYSLGAYIAVHGMKNGNFTSTSFENYTDDFGNLNFYYARGIINGEVPAVNQHIAEQASKYADVLNPTTN